MEMCGLFTYLCEDISSVNCFHLHMERGRLVSELPQQHREWGKVCV